MSKVKYYSLITELRKKNKSDPDFETKVNKLSIEELISLKLELIFRSVGDKSYGLHLWRNIDHLIKESVIKFTLSYCGSFNSARRYLGLDIPTWSKLLKKYIPEDFFDKKSDNPS
jgi:hypothetical protein